MVLRIALLSCLVTCCASAAVADDPYLSAVRRAADALLTNGLDTYGPQKSAMMLSVLDRKTGKPLAKLPKAPAGIRGSDD